MRNILVVGGGTMGAQVALQCARFGYDVTLYDLESAALVSAETQQSELLDEWRRLGLIDAVSREAISRRVHTTTDATEASRNVDLLIECVLEVRRVKADVFKLFHGLCPSHAIFATNASYLTPSMMVRDVGRPSLFVGLHFHNPVWFANVVEVMPHPGTAAETIAKLEAFARTIGQIPIVCQKETVGYVFNAMLQSFLREAITLVETGVTTFENVDRAWMGVMKTPIGPFGILDRIGLDTVRDIIAYWSMASRDPQAKKDAKYISAMVEKGLLGVKSKQGFYQYPNATFESPEFMNPRGSDAEVPGETSRKP